MQAKKCKPKKQTNRVTAILKKQKKHYNSKKNSISYYKPSCLLST